MLRLKSLLSTVVPVAVLILVGASFLTLALPTSAQEKVIPSSHPRISNGTGSSSNWSGYAVTGPAGSVTSVEGSWIAPTVTCSSTTSYAAFWVGIDGYSSSTVEQTGTMAECQAGTPSYYAWYEFYPKGSYEISSVPVSPGNTMSAGVTHSGGEFTTTITDVTTGKTYSTTQAVPSAEESSAEWIAEAPSSSTGILPLADFGTANYGADDTGVASTNYATVSGVTGTISSFGSAVQEITMVSSSGSTEATPSAISSDGTSFSVAWVSGTTTTTTSSTSTSTSTTTTTSSTSTSTSRTTTTSSSSSVTVNSQNQAGAAITGYYAILYGSSGSVADTGFTPATFSTTSGNAYSVQVDNYGSCVFSAWSDGVTSNPRTFTATSSPTTLTAIYNYSGTTPSCSSVTVNSVNQDGTAITGYRVILYSSSGAVIADGFTPDTFTTTVGQSYQVGVENYGSCTFSSWSGGATADPMSFTATSAAQTFTAEYNCG
jgi:hypothetical protein